ncbi:MAG: DUF4367 domain-containing protein [Oscillospiraceae bacterium]
MKEMRMMRTIGDIDDKYIDEAAPARAKRSVIRPFSWAKYAGIAACAVLVLGAGALTVSHYAGIAGDPSQIASDSSDFVQVVSPCVEYDTIEEAEEAVGFGIEIPDGCGAFSERSFSVILGNMLEVRYSDADGNSGFCIRKASGTDDDISGDNNTYDIAAEITVGSRSVTIKGNEDKYFLAEWSYEGYSYAVSAEQGASEEELIELIKNIQ